MALTIRDVALAAGVSPATVSRALRGMGNVDDRTRDRVVAVARSLNYSVSPAASRLATGRSGTIGIVTPYVGRWYFTELFAGIEASLKPYDLDLLLHTTGEPTGHQTMPDAHVRLRRRVDGALVIGLSPDGDEIAGLATLDVPVVLIGSARDGMSSVTIDDRGASRTAVQHLADLGHRRIGLISGRPLPTGFVPENDRLAGYLDVLAAMGLPTDKSLREIGDFTTVGGERAMNILLQTKRPPTAVFCMSDQMAYGAIRAMARHGITPGNDRKVGKIAVIGFDGHELAEVFELSTISQPVRVIGETAVELLMNQIESGIDPAAVRLTTALQRRASTS